MHVLLVEIPGNLELRLRAEAGVVAAGHVIVSHPADTDVVLVCGAAGDELRPVIDRIWDQVPYPKHRSSVSAVADIGAALSVAGTAIADERAQRYAARAVVNDAEVPDRERSQGHAHSSATGSKHSDETNEETQGSDRHEHQHSAVTDAMPMGEHDGMSMGGPGGYPLAGGADDRDGLEMDVLHRRLGPILPSWPAGLVVEVTLAGDTITAASAFLLDAALRRAEREERHVTAATALDQAAQLLALAGWDSAAARLLRVRDLALTGETQRAQQLLDSLHGRITRSALLRWSLRGLEVRPGTTVRAVLLGRLVRAHDALAGRRTEPEPGIGVDDLPPLIIGRDIGSARLVIAATRVQDPASATSTRTTGEHHNA